MLLITRSGNQSCTLANRKVAYNVVKVRLGCKTFSPSFLLPLPLPFCLRPRSDRNVLNDIVIETVACNVRWLIDKD